MMYLTQEDILFPFLGQHDFINLLLFIFGYFGRGHQSNHKVENEVFYFKLPMMKLIMFY